ncbi:hypothetical protein H8E77_23235, partial [bacterium]|nr:hypothetical protein [bacterium]
EGVPNVRVDWVLNRWCDAVGDIIETDDTGFEVAPAFKADGALAPQIKINNLFAVTFTNSKRETLEGRRKDGGNVAIDVGETWINIISNREGETEITAFCPAINDQKRRIISAVTKWIDLDWKFPSDEETEVIEGKISQRTIVTKLSRVGDEGNPPERPVKVCYKILNDLNEGPEATFEDGSIEILKQTNEGRAVATIKLKHKPGNLKTGTNTIEAEIFLSAHGEEKCEYTVSQKFSQHWYCGPNFEVTQKLVRSEISSDELEYHASIGKLEEVQYNITVTNESHCIAQDVILTYIFDAKIFELQEGSNGGVYNGRKVLWNLGDIKQWDSRTVNVKLKAIKETVEDTKNTAEVNYDGPPNDFTTKVCLPELVISCEPNESIIRVKEQDIPEIKITVTNISGIARATDIEVVDDFPENILSFKHASDGGELNRYDDDNYKIEWPPDKLMESGDSKTLTVKFSPKAEGSGYNNIYLKCKEWGDDNFKPHSTLVVIEPAIEIVKFKGPEGTVTVGETADFEVVIKNKGVVKVSID